MHAVAVTVSILGLTGVLGAFVVSPEPKVDKCHCAHAAAETEPAAKVAKKNPLALLTNRNWQHKTPKDARDMTFHLALFDKAKVRTGLTAYMSAWRINMDSVRFKTKGDTLVIESMQDRTVAHLRARIWSCKGEAPKPFDLCLELSSGDKKLRLYSRKSGFSSRGAVRQMEIFSPPHHYAATSPRPALPQWFQDLAN